MKLSSRLARSAIDATRFTATSPHAYSNPTPLRSASLASTTSTSPSTPTPSNSTPRLNPRPLRFADPNGPMPGGEGGGETPAEKVARLRAARMAEREAQVTRWDRVVVWGRRWADTAHRVTVYSLVAFSGMAVFSDFSLLSFQQYATYIPPCVFFDGNARTFSSLLLSFVG